MTICDVWEPALKKTLHASERCQDKRAAFREQLVGIAPDTLVFLDECGLALNLHRLYGWAFGGERCVAQAPKNQGQNRSVLGAFGLPTPTCATGLHALWHVLGSVTSFLFECFIEHELLPRLEPGHVLVLDNARIHHGTRLQEIVQKAGCSLLYLPPYSPDFNPIELVWSWIKNQVRKDAPRTDEHRKQSLWNAAQALPPHAATGWFKKAGILLSD